MASVSFPTNVGGDGSTVTDDANPNTGLRRGGYQTRFVPALTNTVNVANNAKQSAESALASKTAAATSATEAKTSELAAADFANAAQQTTLGFNTNRPTIRPSLNLDFVNQQVVDRRIVVNRNSPKTYFGKEKVLGDENLLRYSEDFGNNVWGKNNVTVVNDNEIAPDGTLTADTLAESNVSNIHVLTQDGAINQLNNASTFSSFFAKKGLGATAPDYVQIYVPTLNYFANFDIVNGVVTLAEGVLDAGVEPSSNGFFRIWIKYLDTGVQHSRLCFVNNNPVSGFAPSYLGQTTSDVIIWGAQLETAREGQTKPTAYVRTDAYPVRTFFNKLQTASANTMPVEFDPITQECLGIKPESQATNLLAYSSGGLLGLPIFSANNGGLQPVLLGKTIAPDGSLDANLYRFDSGGGGLGTSNLSSNLATVSAVNHVGSFFARVKSGQGQILFRHVNVGAYTLAELTTEWKRFSSVELAIAGARRLEIAVRQGVGFELNQVVEVELWGLQLEASTLGVPSSYIPTQNVQQTRQADDLSMPVSAFEYNQNEGTLYAEVNTPVGVDSGLNEFIVDIANGNDRVSLHRASSGANDRHIRSTSQFFGVTNLDIKGQPLDLPSNQVHRAVLTLKENEVLLYLNGELIATDILFPLPNSMATLFLFQSLGGADQFNGYGRSIRYYPVALPTIEAQALSQI